MAAGIRGRAAIGRIVIEMAQDRIRVRAQILVGTVRPGRVGPLARIAVGAAERASRLALNRAGGAEQQTARYRQQKGSAAGAGAHGNRVIAPRAAARLSRAAARRSS